MSSKFLQIPTTLHHVKDRVIAEALEPIRDMVRRRFQGDVSDERVVTRKNLVTLGLATQSQVDKLENE